MRVTGIDHVVFRVEDPERTLDWWRTTFDVGSERLEEWRRGEVPFVSIRLTPTTIIDLVTAGRGEGSDATDGTANVDHVAVEVSDVDLDELAASGTVDVEWGPADLFGARGTGRGLYVRDPDGNRIELRTYP
jgi:glyoxylase I family protein